MLNVWQRMNVEEPGKSTEDEAMKKRRMITDGVVVNYMDRRKERLVGKIECLQVVALFSRFSNNFNILSSL